MRNTISRYIIALFVIGTYAWTWWVQGTAALAVHGVGHATWSNGALTAAGFAPSVVAVTLIALAEGRTGLRSLWVRVRDVRIPLHWWAVAALLPLVSQGASLLVLPLMGRALPALGPWYTPFGMTLLLIPLTGLLEELGWRGLMLHRLQSRMSPRSATLLVAVAWGAWHVPMYLRTMPEGARTPELLAWFLLGILPLSVIFTWLYNATGQRLLPVIVLHASVDAGAGYFFGPVPRGELLPFASWVGLLAIVAAVIIRTGGLGAHATPHVAGAPVPHA